MKHSMGQALEIQKAFEERFGQQEGLLGIGIGLNTGKDDLALNISVSREAQASGIPKTFKGLDVVVDVVGAIRAF